MEVYKSGSCAAPRRVKALCSAVSFFVTTLLTVVSFGIHAETAPLRVTPLDREEDFQDKLRTQEQINQKLDTHLNRAVTIKPASEQPEVAPVDNGIKFPISKIEVDAGDEAKWQVDLSDILRNYVNRELGSTDLFSLIRDVTNRYSEKGFATTTVSLVPKNMKSGVVDLKINWGKVDGWLINGHEPQSRYEKLVVQMAMPGVTQRPFNIHDIDQIVENLNTVSKSARIDVQPSSRIGYSTLNIVTEDKSTPSLTLRADNSGAGSPSQGRYRYTASTSLSDLLLGNDSLGLNLSSRRYQDEKNNAEYSAGANYSIPFGYSKLDLRFNHSQYDKQLKGRYGFYGSSGNSQVYDAKFSQVLMREKTQRLSAVFELEHKRNANFIEKSLLAINSKPYTNLSLGLDHVTDLFGGSLYSDASWVQGISFLTGEKAAFDQSRAEKHLSKIEFNTAWSRPFSLFDRNFSFSSRIGGQYAKDNLLTSEQLGLGDEFTVRGYKTPVLWGDRGIFMTNTLSLPIPVAGGSISPFVGWDIGKTENVAYKENNGRIEGFATGVNGSWRYGGGSLTLGLPLSEDSGAQQDQDVAVVYMSAYLTY